MTVPDLVGKRTVLVPMRLSEADGLVAWVNHADAQAHWFGREATRAEVLEKFPPVLFDDAYPQKGRAFRVEEAGKVVGAVVHYAAFGVPRNARVELVLAPEAEAGAGSDALEALARYLFDAIRARRLWTEVPEGDARSLAAFEGAGFALAGRTAEGGRRILHRDRPQEPGARRGAASKKPK